MIHNAWRGESPLFLKTHEMLLWLLAHTQNFPKSQRFVLAKRMEDAALDFHDCLLRAGKSRRKSAALTEADVHLDRLRRYNRLAHGLKLHNETQYEHLARIVEELGRLLGGWLRTAGPASASPADAEGVEG